MRLPFRLGWRRTEISKPVAPSSSGATGGGTDHNADLEDAAAGLDRKPAHPRRASALIAIAGLTGAAGVLAATPRKAEASYIPGGGPNGWDKVDTGLLVASSLVAMNNVGIGTTTPPQALSLNNAGNVYIAFMNNGTSQGFLGAEINGGSGMVWGNTSGIGFVRMMPSGNVGIGTNSPASTLDVAGSIRCLSAVVVNGITAINGSGVATSAYYAP